MVINPINPERQRPAYYEDYLKKLQATPQNLIPQYSQLNVTPQYGYMGNKGVGQLMDRGSVTPSGLPESNATSLGMPPSILPRPGMEQISPFTNRLVNVQKTTTMIMPSQSVIPSTQGSFGKKQKPKKSGKKKKGFYGI